jgi:hypothetical protein
MASRCHFFLAATHSADRSTPATRASELQSLCSVPERGRYATAKLGTGYTMIVTLVPTAFVRRQTTRDFKIDLLSWRLHLQLDAKIGNEQAVQLTTAAAACLSPCASESNQQRSCISRLPTHSHAKAIDPGRCHQHRTPSSRRASPHARNRLTNLVSLAVLPLSQECPKAARTACVGTR